MTPSYEYIQCIAIKRKLALQRSRRLALQRSRKPATYVEALHPHEIDLLNELLTARIEDLASSVNIQ